MTDQNKKFMNFAVELSQQGSNENKGGPFGAIVVKDGEMVGMGYNQVTSSNDPTAHAEVVAIRDACKNLHTFQLTGCEIYTSCEPCPMCLGAIYWARPEKVFYANTRYDAAAIGFDDSFIYDEINRKMTERKIPMIKIECENAIKIFNQWKEKQNKIGY
jgi:guanine deaminase